MSVFLAIESCPAASPTTSPQPPQMPKPTKQSKEEAHNGFPMSHLWKGICNLFTGIFKPKEERSWEETAKRQEEEIIALKAMLAEKTESEKNKRVWMEGQIEQGAKSLQDALQMFAKSNHTLRMGEIQWLVAWFQHHEKLVEKHQRYTQAYHNLATKYEQVRADNEFLMRQNEELSSMNIELKRSLNRERGKNAMYERAWYGSGGGTQPGAQFQGVDVCD